MTSKAVIYSPSQITGAAIIGGPAAGGWLIRHNYKTFGETEKASRSTQIIWLVLLLLPLLTTILIHFLSQSALNAMAVPLAFLIGGIAQDLQGSLIKEAEVKGIAKGSNWKLVGISICWAAITFIVIILLLSIKNMGGWIAYGGVLGTIGILTIVISKIPPRFHLVLHRIMIVLGIIIAIPAAIFGYSMATLPALYLPTSHGDVHEVEELLDKGTDLNAQTILGETPLIVAARKGYTEIAKMLIDRHANLNTKTRLGGFTALRESSTEGYTDIVRLLLAKGADVNAPDNHGSTPLTVSAEHGYAEIAELLLNAGANIEARDDDGDTALLDAVVGGQISTTRLLLDKGADINAKDKAGKTALMLAEEKRYEDIATLLKTYQKK